ncbi:MAG: hypothetical protein IT302_07610 [Dehalococcoidia bacterium]|nr:hypothetical protein [Dehalococcoidia bacterium]
MNRKQKILASAALPAVLAIGVATGVAFAQMPGDSHHDNGSGSMDMRQTMQPGAMQDHMKEMLSENAYARMLEAMANHGAGMPMGMGDMDGMVQAMAASLGSDGEMPAGTPAGAHSEHHP